jgi:Cu/Ag efflux pump CusA
MDATESMFHAATQRMRPMLMTALSACIGLLPAAVSSGIGRGDPQATNEAPQPSPAHA